MLKAKYRKNLDGLHIRIGLLFSKIGISPNAWTILSLVPALAGLYLLFYGNLFLGLVFFVISAFIDIIDGNVARVTKSVSNLGAFMDGVIDRYVEFALYIGLWFFLLNAQPIIFPMGFWIILLLFGSMMPSFVSAYADHRNVVTNDEQLKNMGGLMERFERLSLIYLGMLLGLINPLILNYFIILTSLLTNITAIQRIFSIVSKS